MTLSKSFNQSYWEMKHLFFSYDLIVVGSGIVGLSTAISYKQKNKKAKVLILEKSFFLDGASIKNAGFACFGTAGELTNDLKSIEHHTVWETLQMRWEGLSLLRKRLGDKHLKYEALGGFELFNSQLNFEKISENLPFFNSTIESILNLKNCYTIDKSKSKHFHNIHGVIKNKHEGQLDSGSMMKCLVKLAQQLNIQILNGITVTQLNDLHHKVELNCNYGIFSAHKVVVATNGFANSLLKLNDLKPARAQVLVTKPIKKLKIKGAFHFDEGYYYFRNIDNRILFGGGRNLDFINETTTDEGLNAKIQNQLNVLLKTTILSNTPHEIDYRWSGIMGVGSEKKPIIKKASKNVLAAVRMGGMGIAIGSWVGKKAAASID